MYQEPFPEAEDTASEILKKYQTPTTEYKGEQEKSINSGPYNWTCTTCTSNA